MKINFHHPAQHHPVFISNVININSSSLSFSHLFRTTLHLCFLNFHLSFLFLYFLIAASMGHRVDLWAKLGYITMFRTQTRALNPSAKPLFKYLALRIKLKNSLSNLKESLNIQQCTGRAQNKHRWSVTHRTTPPPHRFLQLKTLFGPTRRLSLKPFVKVSDLAPIFSLPKTIHLLLSSWNL